MKHTIKFLGFFIIIFFYSAQSSSAQDQLIFNGDTVNQRDSNGKKHGRWAAYLDAYGQTTKKLENAKFYYIYNYYHGQSMLILKLWFPYSGSADSWRSLINENTEKEFPILLDGEYKWYTKFGQVKSIAKFENGILVFLKVYSDKRYRNKVDDEKLNQLSEHKYFSDESVTHLIKFNRKGQIWQNRYYIFDGNYVKQFDTNDTIHTDW